MATQSLDPLTAMSSISANSVNSMAAGMSTDELRKRFLATSLFKDEGVNLIYTDLDRMIVGGVRPRSDTPLLAPAELRSECFTERREIGIINIGDPGVVRVKNQAFQMQKLDCLYVGRGCSEVVFEARPDGHPAYYLVSAPAHRSFPTRKIARDSAEVVELGDESQGSKRRLVKLIHPTGICSAQLLMGYTELFDGNVWNTMPPHTHARRSEVYFYFDLDDQIVVHLLGRPENSRHLIVRNCEAVLSPSWSMHAGVGTKPYRFAWAMAGENKDFADIDPIPLDQLY